MDLLLIRSQLSKTCTLGDLLLEPEKPDPTDGANLGKWLCYTLEDPWHEKKIYGDTCVPEGRYETLLAYSNRFKKIMPRLLGVPGFDGVLVHGGNTKANTLGCILVGSKRGIDSISDCAPALDKVRSILMQKGKHYITIVRAEVWKEQFGKAA